MSEDSLNRRYSAKVIANGFGIFTGVITAGLVPRMLGPSQLGAFTFITNFFSVFLGLVSAGASQWFFIRLSQRINDEGLKRFYWLIVSIAFLIGVAFILVIQYIGIYPKLWPEIQLSWAWWALFLGTAMWISSSVGQMADAAALTVGAEKFRVAHKVISVGTLVVLYVVGVRDITSFFLYSIAIQLIWIFGVVIIFRCREKSVFPEWRNSSQAEFRRVVEDFWEYCSPLFGLAVISGAILLAERWVLQHFGGAVEQGYFGLSERTAAMAFLFVAPMVPLFSRELAIAIGDRDDGKVSHLVERLVPQMYTVAVFFSVFLMINTKDAVRLIGGNEFQNAVPTVAVMAAYPILQTLGQMVGGIFYATGKTREYRNVSLVFTIAGLIIAYFLMAGLRLGSLGLAIRTVVVALAMVSTLLFVGGKLIGINSSALFRRLILIFLIAVVLAVVGYFCTQPISDWRVRIFSSGVVYTTAFGCVVAFFSSVFGVDISRITSLISGRRR